ncbi:MAG: hypothetical protein GX050_08025 [Firmicutes bacterium]|nr:hypothetical protein [Bacillota bacterium]
MAQGLMELTNRLKEEARREAEAELARSREEAERLTAEFRKETEEEIAALRAEYQRRAEEEKRRIISQAEMEARLQVLGAKQDLIHAAFEQALAALLQLPVEEKRRLYQDLLLSAVEEGTETIAVAAAEKVLWTEIIASTNRQLASEGRRGMLNLSAEPAEINGGFLLKSSTYEINASLEKLVADLEERYYPEVAGILFN